MKPTDEKYTAARARLTELTGKGSEVQQQLDKDGEGLVLIEDIDPETKEECLLVTKDPTLIEMYCDRIDMSRGGPPQPRGVMSREERRLNPLATLAGVSSPVLPHDPCTRCLKGDTNRALLVDGDRAFFIWLLIQHLELTRGEAEDFADQAPDPSVKKAVLLCRACAARIGVKVYSLKTIDRMRTEGFELMGVSQSASEAAGVYRPD